MNDIPQLHGFTKTYRYKLLIPAKADQLLKQTTEQYRKVVEYYLQVFQDHQEILGQKAWLRLAEALTHRTKNNPWPEYDFDEQFPNYPSGFRRAGISEAYGLACAWKKSYTQWESQKDRHEEKNLKRIARGKKPIKFTDHPPQYPKTGEAWLVYYNTEWKQLDSNHIKLKVATGRSYVYQTITLLQPLVIPLNYAIGSPSLVLKPTGWELHTPLVLTKRMDLQKIVKLVKIPNLKICCVDLGINRHAVITIQDTKGRVYATKVISGAKDNHLRKRYLEKIVSLQKQTRSIPKGERFAKDLWNKVSNLNNDIAHRVSKEIIKMAETFGAKIIVFEYLNNLKPEKGIKSRWLNSKLGYWVKARIFNYTSYKGLHQGIITCRVTPKKTSSRCPYCGFETITRYTLGKPKGVDLAKCDNCGIHGVNSDYIGSLGIGRNFRLKYSA